MKLAATEPLVGNKAAVSHDTLSRGAHRRPHIVVISYNNVGNFGDRLGFHLLNSLLPTHAYVTYAHFDPWDVPDGPIDLLILGIGNSLFHRLLSDDLLHLLDRASKTVGIFGTQYRELIDLGRMGAVIDRLDRWYARSIEDIDAFGLGRTNVVHLGDWLIDGFCMTDWTNPKVLKIGEEIWHDLPLDRVIQRIQSFRYVLSPSLHPLLCALTSAERVSYSEQYLRECASGKFRSLLLDVFGTAYPENALFRVDKRAVISYKAHVRGGIERLAQDLRMFLLAL